MLGVALAVILHLRLTLPGPVTFFSTADNPTAKANSIWTRFLTFTYLPVFNFKLLLNPTTLSFDWGMDAIPRVTSLFDSRNIVSVIFYTTLCRTVWTNIKILKLRLPVLVQREHRKARTTKKRVPHAQSQDCICTTCKQGLSVRHTSVCRANNNNNIPLPSVQCGCLPVSPIASTSMLIINPRAANDNSTPSTSVAILLSIALLTLPFLPAANLFFYVGFVVAERILYLPSVGYCLLVGLGIGKLMDPQTGSIRSSQTKRRAVLFSVCCFLVMCSAKTVLRNYDWRDEESLYRSAIGVNPPKGNL